MDILFDGGCPTSRAFFQGAGAGTTHAVLGPQTRQRPATIGVPALASNCFPGSPAEPAIGFGSRSLGSASGLSTNLTESGCHPALGSKKALQKARHVEIRIELGEVNSETGWSDLNFVKLRWLGVLQTLSIARRETQNQF